MSEGSIKEYSGPSGALKDSPWLAAEDLPLDRDTVVTIETVLMLIGVPMDKGRELSGGALAFGGKKKRLILNSGKRKILNRLFTNDTSQWPGKTIALYVDPTVRFGSTVTGGICIRDKAAEKLQKRAEELAGQEPPPPSASDAPALCEMPCGDTTKDEPDFCGLETGHDGPCEPAA